MEVTLPALPPFSFSAVVCSHGWVQLAPFSTMKMVSQEWYEGRPVGPAEVAAAFERWGAWKGLAYWFWDWSETPA